MDATDRKILQCLRANARENASVIGEKVNMSVSAVIERIRKLENAGIIRQYTVVLDMDQLGQGVIAYISVAIESPRHMDEFMQFIKQYAPVTCCHYVTGEYDFYLVVHTDSTNALEQVIKDIKNVPGVARTKTQVVLSTIKNDFSAHI